MLHVSALNSWQRRTVVMAWITYAAYYLGRVNLSTAMPEMQADLGFSARQIGLLSTGFFWTYAVSQLINGRLGDRFSPRWFVLAGMGGTAAINLMFSQLSAWPLLMVLWTGNGYFQATGWGPILRLLANWLTPRQRTRVSGIFGSCFVAGNAFTWLLTGWIVAKYGWRAGFWAPALLLLAIGSAWLWIVRDAPQKGDVNRGPQNVPVGSGVSVGADLANHLRHQWPITVAAAFVGFCFVSLIVWMPTYYVEVGRLNIGQSATLAALLPIAGIAGTLLIGWLVGHHLLNRELPALTTIMVVAGLLFFSFPLFPFHVGLSTTVLMLAASIIYGASSLTLTTIPLTLSSRQSASSIAGLMGFAFNVGAGMSGGIVGALLDTRSWNAVFVGLSVAALAAAVCMGVAHFQSRKRG